MNLLPGYLCLVAPFFPLMPDWTTRLAAFPGVDLLGDRFFPRGSPGPLDADDLALFVRDPGLPLRQDDLDESIAIYALPRHLQEEWWSLVERNAGIETGRVEGLEEFSVHVASFLQFKGLSLPKGTVADLVVSRPGQRSIRWDAAIHDLGGLVFNLIPSTAVPVTATTPTLGLYGGVNLGSEPASLVLCNLSPEGMLQEWRRWNPEQPMPTTLGELAGWFLATFEEYPVLRLRIEPGEGFQLPRSGIIVDGETLESVDPAIWLFFQFAREGSSESASEGG